MCSHVPDIINLNVSCCNDKEIRVPLEEQELVILPKHLSSIPVLVGFVLLNLYVSLQCFMFFFSHLVIALSVLLRFATSDYPFGIVIFFLTLDFYSYLM